MLLQDILTLAKTRLANLAVARNNEALVLFINLGISELYRRFNLSVKSETILMNSSLALYELKNPDVSLLVTVFDKYGRELAQTDVIDSEEWEYKIVNYRSFVVNKPFNGYLYALYKASPIMYRDVEDEVDLPDAMLDALLSYVAYMAHTTISTQSAALGRGQLDCDTHYSRFINACNELEMQGFKIPLNTETRAIYIKGYV